MIYKASNTRNKLVALKCEALNLQKETNKYSFMC